MIITAALITTLLVCDTSAQLVEPSPTIRIRSASRNAESHKLQEPQPRIRAVEPQPAPRAIPEHVTPIITASDSDTRPEISIRTAPVISPTENVTESSLSSDTKSAPMQKFVPRVETKLEPEIKLNRSRTLLNAIRFFDRKEFSKAESACIEVLHYYPNDTIAMTLIGAVLFKLNRPSEAVPIFMEFVRQQPLDAMAHFYLGLAYHLSGDKKSAIEEYWSAKLIDPSLEAAQANLKQLTELN